MGKVCLMDNYAPQTFKVVITQNNNAHYYSNLSHSYGDGYRQGTGVCLEVAGGAMRSSSAYR